MELIRTIRARHQTARENTIQREAEETITLSDFSDNIFIAYNGMPLVPIEKSWKSEEIMQELSKVRQNYINARKKQLCL